MDEITPLDGRSHSPATREAFATWIATPTELRVPPTQKAWAEAYGVDPATCWRWRQSPEFRQTVAERVRAWYLDSAPDVIKALVEGAKAGHPKLIEIFMRHVGEIWHAGVEDLVSDRDDAEALVAALTQSDFARVAQAKLEDFERKRREIASGQVDESRLAVMADRLNEAVEEEGQAGESEGDLSASG